ncbi:hypothetical protein SRHO_G00275360 [Serrasalmus rhombeus]
MWGPRSDLKLKPWPACVLVFALVVGSEQHQKTGRHTGPAAALVCRTAVASVRASRRGIGHTKGYRIGAAR